MSREYNVGSILESLNKDTTVINEEQRDMVEYYKDKFKKFDKGIEVIEYKPSGLGSNTTTLILQDKKSKNYFIYRKGATGYVTSISLVETPDSSKSILSHYINGISEDEEAAQFIISTRDYKKYAKSYSALKTELQKLSDVYKDLKALDPEGSFQDNDAKRGLFEALNKLFSDSRVQNYL